MKKTVVIILAVLPIFLLFTIAFAGRFINNYKTVEVERVHFTDKYNTPYTNDKLFEIEVGQEKRTYIKIIPEDATNKRVFYSSSNEEICKINEDGVILGVSAGTTEVIVLTHNGDKKAFLNVIVKEKSVTGVTLPYSEKTLVLGESIKLSPTIIPDGAENKNVTYTTSDDSIIKVDSNGIVKSVGIGEATITVTTVDGGHTANCLFTITDGTPCLAFDFSSTDQITKLNDAYVVKTENNKTQYEINLNEYIKYDSQIIEGENIKISIDSGNSYCSLSEDNILTLFDTNKELVSITVSCESLGVIYLAQITITLQR